MFDVDKQEYYNKRSDIYLTEDDVKYHKLPVKEELPGYKIGANNG